MAVVIKLVQIGMIAGLHPTPFDGQYVVEYDAKPFVRNIIGAHLVTSPDLDQAKRFVNEEEALAYVTVSRGVRPWDGKPDRPLTAFTLTIDDELAFALEEAWVPITNRLEPRISYFAEDSRRE